VLLFALAEVKSQFDSTTDAYTVLVPTNDAFSAALPLVNITVDQLLSGSERDSAAVGALLAYHTFPEGAFTQQQLARYTSLTSLLSLMPDGYTKTDNVTITKDARHTVTFTGTKDSTATVIVPDIRAQRQPPGQGKSFVAHIVDGVLLPPAEVLANATTLSAENATEMPGILVAFSSLAPDAGNMTSVAAPAADAGNTTMLTISGAGNAPAADAGNTTMPTTSGAGSNAHPTVAAFLEASNGSDFNITTFMAAVEATCETAGPIPAIACALNTYQSQPEATVASPTCH
jgi:uncharacterized surface protein with fasciclin (FAS1) repeats